MAEVKALKHSVIISDKSFEGCKAEYDRICNGVKKDFGVESNMMQLIFSDMTTGEDESKTALKRLTKDELIAATRQCFRIYQSFISLRHRYDCLKASMDILKDKNTGYLQMVRQIEELYENLEKDNYTEYTKSFMEFESFTNNLPQEAWIQ